MADPVLDPRSTDDFYRQSQLLAEAYCPEWSQYWPTPLDAAAVDQDPGLVMLNLFSLLAKYLADIENQVPGQRRLSFFQFLNLQLRPPLPAQTPLCFTLRAGQPPRMVPARSGVQDAPTQTIRFETAEPLLVVPATLGAALTIIPAQDQCINALPLLDQGRPVPIFTSSEDDPAVSSLGHWFLIGDPALFKPDPALQSITITLTGQNLHAPYFGQWTDGALTPLTAEVRDRPDGLQVEITLRQMPQAGAVGISTLEQRLYTADGGTGDMTVGKDAAADTTAEYWLTVRPDPQLRILTALERQLPVITAIACVFSGSGIPPQQAASNQALMDIANGGYPFGQTPQLSDAFYIRADTVFAKTGAQVTLTFDLRPVASTYPVRVEWQFWDGSAWASFNGTAADVSLHQFTDTTSNLQGNTLGVPTTVSFVCPAIATTTVAGTKGRWIRAVIAEGGYGKLGGYASAPVSDTIDAIPDSILTEAQKQQVTDYLTKQAGVSFSYSFDPSTYAPPFIAGLSIGYRQTAKPSRYWSYNTFELTRFLFSPFKPPADRYAGFHFGFTPADFATHTLGRQLTLFFYMADERAAPGPGLEWQAFDGAAWQPLEVDDGTAGLTRSGIVRFTVPDSMAAGTLFSQTLFWFRVNTGQPRRDIRLFGLYPNSVGASNTVGVDEEVLGSGNGQPSLRFQLDHAPVLPGVALDVIEPQGLQPEDGPLTVTPPDTDPASPGMVRRRWTQVETFAFSGPADRVYTLDTANGIISFGDGRNGMIPPPGHDNIIAAHYDHTAGIDANLPADTLTVLRPGIADITGVRNPMPARDGVDGDTRDTIAEAGPAQIKAWGRAVDAADYGTLAEAASPLVARARALVDPGPVIRIVVLPRSQAARPYADPALIDHVHQAVADACPAPMARRIQVAGADYLPIDVTAQVTGTVDADQRLAFQQTLAARITAFLHPVFGGPDGKGWRFGQAVRASAVLSMLRQDPQVATVPGLSLNGRAFGDVAVPDGQVAAAGTVQVYAYVREAAA